MAIVRLTGFRYVAFVSFMVGAVGLTLYPIVIEPIMHGEEYKKKRKVTDELLNKEKH